MSLRRRPLLVAALAAASLLAFAAPASAHADNKTILRAPIAGSLPTDPSIFGVAPGAAPWVIDRGFVRVRQNGRIVVKVDDFVIPAAPFNGTNPLPRLSASVFCGGALADTTAPVPFSTEGDAVIRDRLSLPADCLAPVVLLHPNEVIARYIGVSGGRG